MSKFSRRTLAHYAVDQLLDGKPASTVAKELAAVTSDSSQYLEVDFLFGDITWELENRHELAHSLVTAAHKLDQTVLDDLEEQLKKATGAKEILLETSQDKSLIGGLRIETANRVWDYSVARRLSQLREMF